jgi:hypothetical protein
MILSKSVLIGLLAAILSAVTYILMSFARTFQVWNTTWGRIRATEVSGPWLILVIGVAFAIGFQGSRMWPQVSIRLRALYTSAMQRKYRAQTLAFAILAGGIGGALQMHVDGRIMFGGAGFPFYWWTFSDAGYPDFEHYHWLGLALDVLVVLIAVLALCELFERGLPRKGIQ